MPYYSRMFGGGRITKWLKVEGERIDCGDALFEFQVEEVRVTKTIKAGNPREWLQQMAMLMKGNPEAAARPVPTTAGQGEFNSFKSWEAVVILRVHSSDQGFLRRICAREGEYREVGGLLALVTLEETEPLDEPNTAGAGVLRVVVDMTDEERDDVESNSE
jgi:hypothetical protein